VTYHGFGRQNRDETDMIMTKIREELGELWPETDIYVDFADEGGGWPERKGFA
jgi:hypothetical protein